MILTLRAWPEIISKPLIFEFSALSDELLSAILTIIYSCDKKDRKEGQNI